ncbi:MAG: hypothetical protein COA64_00355 [Henriciella sp.]|nr:MAG: hypothetical protein COA64_00355 [Henriciella sp.]
MICLWTDYPIVELGDEPGKRAPVRRIDALHEYDGDRYVKLTVGGVTKEIKSGYIYTKPGRLGEVPSVSRLTLATLTPKGGE